MGSPVAVFASAEETSRPAPSGSDLASVIDKTVPKQLADNEIPGAAVTVVADGETVFSSGYGDADPPTDQPMRAESTRLYAASEAKLFTATAALQLVERGKLDLDRDVNDYLETTHVPEAFPDRPVTLRHLLTYTSGFDYSVYGWSRWQAGELPTLEEFTDIAMPERVRPPGELPAYNNFDFVLAGRLIEIVSGQDFDDYIEENVFAPAAMDDSTVRPPEAVDADALPIAVGGNRPTGQGQESTGGHVSPATPTGANVATTSADMGRFMNALMDESSPLGSGVADELEDAQFSVDPELPGVGFAFERRSITGHNVVTKDGDLPGVHHNLAMLPEESVGIHVEYNGDGVDGSAFWAGKQLVRTIIDAMYPGEGSADANAAADPPEKNTGPDVSAFAGSYEAARTSRSEFARVATLTSPVTVEAGSQPGVLSTSGLSDDPAETEQTWKQTSPRHFELDDGDETLVFTSKGDMVTSQMPSNSFSPLPWYQSPSLHLAAVGLATAALLVGVVAFPVRAVLGRFQAERETDSGGARSARAIAWLAGVSVAIFAAAFAIVSADSNRLAEIPLTGDPVLSFALNTMTVTAALTIAMVIFSVWAWVRGWWGPVGRISYTLLTLAAVFLVAISVHYRLIGLPFSVPI